MQGRRGGGRRAVGDVDERGLIRSRAIKTWGSSESAISELIADQVDAQTNPTIAFLARGYEGIWVRCTAKAMTEEDAIALQRKLESGGGLTLDDCVKFVAALAEIDIDYVTPSAGNIAPGVRLPKVGPGYMAYFGERLKRETRMNVMTVGMIYEPRFAEEIVASGRADMIVPDRAAVTMTVPFMRAYTELLVQTCHKRGAFAMGGMAAFIPNRRDPEVTNAALARVKDDKERESRDGFDGTWVAHPDLIPTAMAAFDAILPEELLVEHDGVHLPVTFVRSARARRARPSSAARPKNAAVPSRCSASKP